MLFNAWLPQLPQTILEYAVLISSIIGIVCIIYSQFIEALNRRDLVRMIGAAGLLVYAVWIRDGIFTVVFLGIFLASLIEFIEIYLGFHRSEETQVKKYKEINKKYRENQNN